MRTAAIVQNGVVTNVIVLADGDEGDASIEMIPGCVECTGVNVRIGSLYEDGEFVWVKTEQEIAAEAEYAALVKRRKALLDRLGLTEDEARDLLG